MTTVPDATLSGADAVRQRWRLPLIGALAVAFVSLALISGAAYLAVFTGATGTAERLLVDRAARVVDRQIAEIRSRLDPVTEQLELIAALIGAGRIDISSPVAVREALAVMVAKLPGVSAAAFERIAATRNGPMRPSGVLLILFETNSEMLAKLRGSIGSC